MATYRIQVAEILVQEVDVTGKSLEAALEKVKKKLQKEIAEAGR